MGAEIVVCLVHLLSTCCVLGPGRHWGYSGGQKAKLLGGGEMGKTNSSAHGAHILERETGTKRDKHTVMW